MFGLIVSDPAIQTEKRETLTRLLYEFDLPLTGFTEEPAPLFAENMSRAAFLRTASAALLQPGQPLPMEALLTYISSDPLPANVLRKYLFLQFSLLPYLRPGRTVTPVDGCFLLGDDLLIAPVSPEDTVDVQLPPGIWTELNGACWEGRLRQMRGYNEIPVLVRENTLLPIGVNDRSADHNDADRLTLHWFQPHGQSDCSLADGTWYMVQEAGDAYAAESNTKASYHLIVHRDGDTQVVF